MVEGQVLVYIGNGFPTYKNAQVKVLQDLGNGRVNVQVINGTTHIESGGAWGVSLRVNRDELLTLKEFNQNKTIGGK